MLPLALLLLLPGLVDVSSPEEPMLLDRVVAVFESGGDKTVITLSLLEGEARMALAARGAVEAAHAPLDGDLLATSLDWLIAEHLLLEEAKQLDLDAVDPEEVLREMEAFMGQFPSEEAYLSFLQRFEIVENDLSRMARRRLVVGRYLDSRIRLAGGVTDRDVEEAWAGKKAELGNMSFEDARLPLRAQLEKERRERVVASLVSDLRMRARVRILHRFE